MNKQFARSLVTFLAVILVSTAAGAEGDVKLSKGQAVYVPVYSHIYGGDREQVLNLTVTLSIRNTDLSHAIHILSVDYLDSGGRLIRRYLEQPVLLNPMASTRYVIKESDKSGGSGASFIVTWKSDHDVSEPVMESVMISTRSMLGLSFTSRGQVIKEEFK